MEPEAEPYSLGARVAALATIVLILVVTGFLYVVHVQRPAVLRLEFVAGQAGRDRLELSIDGSVTEGGQGPQPLHVALTETLAWRVLTVSARPAAVARIELRVTGGTMTANGQTTVLEPGPATAFSVTPDGRALTSPDPSVVLGGRPGTGLPGVGALLPLLPVRAVAPPQTWDRAFDQAFPFGAGSLPYRVHGRLERYDDLGPARAAVIQVRTTVPVGVTLDIASVRTGPGSSRPPGSIVAVSPAVRYTGRVDQEQTWWLDPDRGRPIRSAGRGTLDLTLGFQGFSPLFPTIQSGSGSGLGLPFGGAPSGATPGALPVHAGAVRIRAAFTLASTSLP